MITHGAGDGFGTSVDAISLAERSLDFSPLLADAMATTVAGVMVEAVIGFGVGVGVGNAVFCAVATLSIAFGFTASSLCFFIFFDGFTVYVCICMCVFVYVFTRVGKLKDAYSERISDHTGDACNVFGVNMCFNF